MKFIDINEAERRGLVRITIWVPNTPKEIDFLLKMMEGVLDDIKHKRRASIVKKPGLLALYANEV